MPTRSRRMLGRPVLAIRLLATLVMVAQGSLIKELIAQESTPKPVSTETFSEILTSETHRTFVKIRDYCQNPVGPSDLDAAAAWLFATSREFGWEADAVSLAQVVSENEGTALGLRRQALAVAALGSARSKNRDRSREFWAKYLRSLRLRGANEAVDVAQSLALVWQLAGNVVAAKEVYADLNGAFLLNGEIQDFVESRTRRLDLVGKPVPELGLTDLGGQSISWKDFHGNWLVIDCWATNCRPCLEELPRLRRLYRDFSARNVAFLGISYDEERPVVEQFLASEPVPWRIAQGRDAATTQLHVRLIPCVILMDPVGQVRAVDVRPADLSVTLKQILARPVTQE